MATILAVGIATLDIINRVKSYPNEDDEIRTLNQYKARGGNATNSLTVLNQLGHKAYWAGVLVEQADSQFIIDDLAANHIDTRYCQRLDHGKMPTSYITVSEQTGSRTIIHHRDCPEYSFAEFANIDLNQFDWVHFEGRNIEQTRLMLQHLKKHYPQLPCSLEIEKPRDNIEQLFDLATVLLFSQHYAQHHRFEHAEQLLTSLADNIVATCTWGQAGAWARNHQGQLFHAQATAPTLIKDTLAAGDTFNAGLIDQLVNKHDLEQALNYACRLASHKCGQQGLANLLTHFK